MALNARQQRLYKHQCNIWSVTRAIGPNGKPGDETWSLFAVAVPCYYEYTPNVDDAVDAVGRVKRMTIFTTDTVHMEASQVIEDGWILKNVTLLPDGTPSEVYGTFHRVLGAPRIIANSGNRHANKREVMAMSMEKPPAGVV